jgi:hypothetical protein
MFFARLLSLVMAEVAIVGLFVEIPIVSNFAFWIMVAAYLLWIGISSYRRVECNRYVSGALSLPVRAPAQGSI